MAIERQSQRKIESEDALKHLLDCEEMGSAASVDSVSGSLSVRGGNALRILGDLRSQGLADPGGDMWLLTETGRRAALEIVRRHRLYETWLAQEEGLPADELHAKAHIAEHHLDQEATDALAEQLGNPRFDPHGDPIPTREGDLPVVNRISLAEWDVNQAAIIEHVEDEPVSIYRKIVKAGLYAGMVLSRMEKLADGGVRVLIEGRLLEVSSEFLGMIHVAKVPDEEMVPEGIRSLNELEIGEQGVVYGLSASCYGPERRRLLDIGIVPGTKIRCEFQSPFSSPRAYHVRGTLFGFRTEQAEKILLEPKND